MNKFKNPYFWISIIAVIFAAAGVDFNTLTSWELLFDALRNIVLNPVSVMAVMVALLGVWNDNGTKGFDLIRTKEKINDGI